MKWCITPVIVFLFVVISNLAQARTDYCVIGPPRGNELPKCTSCSSPFSGDVGKAACLVQHPGDHVNFGKCDPKDCHGGSAVTRRMSPISK